MRLRILLSILSLAFFDPLYAMDSGIDNETDSTTDRGNLEHAHNGVNVADIRELLENQRQNSLSLRRCSAIYYGITAISGLVAGISGTVLCLAGCLPDDYSNRTMSSPEYCYAGAGVLSYIGLSIVCWPFLPQWLKLINYLYKKKYHEPVDEAYGYFESFDEDNIILYPEIIVVKNYVFSARSQFYEKINNFQAFVMANLDEEKFGDLAKNNSFSDSVNVFSNHYLLLYHMNNEELKAALARDDVKQFIRENPFLVAFIQKRLQEEVAIEKVNLNKNEQVLIKNNQQQYLIDKMALRKMSASFDAMFNDIIDEHEILLTDGLIEAPSILYRLAQGEVVEINENNLMMLLLIARQYILNDLTDSCDDYIIDNKLLKPLTLSWFKKRSRALTHEINDQGTFCSEFGLDRSKRNMISTLAQEINLKTPDEIYDIMASLNKEHQIAVVNISMGSILLSLNTVELLKIYARIAIEFELINLKQIVYYWCKNPENQKVWSKIWLSIPKELRP